MIKLNGLMTILNFVCLIVLCSCGVRGRPLPPEKPAPLGRGQPSFNKATENIVIPSSSSKKKNADSQDEE